MRVVENPSSFITCDFCFRQGMFPDRTPGSEKIRTTMLLKGGLVQLWHDLEELFGEDHVTVQYLIKASGTTGQ